MRSMSQSELMEEISNYKDLVEKASTQGATQIASDLQQDLGSLKLSGIIGDGDQGPLGREVGARQTIRHGGAPR